MNTFIKYNSIENSYNKKYIDKINIATVIFPGKIAGKLIINEFKGGILMFYKIKNYLLQLEAIDFIEIRTGVRVKEEPVTILDCFFKSGLRQELMLDGLDKKELDDIVNNYLAPTKRFYKKNFSWDELNTKESYGFKGEKKNDK